MIAIAIALGAVGLAAVLAAWHVARAWIARDGAMAAHVAKLGEEITLHAGALDRHKERLDALEADAAEVQDAARKLRLKRLGGRAE